MRTATSTYAVIPASDKYFLMFIMPIRLAGNLAMRKNEMMLLFLQTRNRRDWRQEGKDWGVRSEPFLCAVTARWAGVGVALMLSWLLSGHSATSRTLYFFCPRGSLGESLTSSAQLCDCDQEPDLPICSPSVCFARDVHVALLIIRNPLTSYSGRDSVAIMGSHLRGLKISRRPWDLQDKEAFWQRAGSAAWGAVTAVRWGRQHHHPNVSARIRGSSVLPLNYHALGLKEESATGILN